MYFAERWDDVKQRQGLPRPDRWIMATVMLCYALGWIALHFCRGPLDFSGSYDELNFHYPAFLTLYGHFPGALQQYPSATGPFSYLVAMPFSALFGQSLPVLRTFNVIGSMSLALSVYWLLFRQVGLRRSEALLVMAVAVLSPYVLGSTYVVMTDNSAWLWCVLSLFWALRFARSGRLWHVGLAAVFVAFASTTRQTGIWVGFADAAIIWPAGLDRQVRRAGLAILALGALPLAGLVLLWHGLTPNYAGTHEGFSASNLRADTMCLTMLGFYGLFFMPKTFFARTWEAVRGRPAIIAVGLLLCLALLFTSPLAEFVPGQPRSWQIDGYLVKVMDKFPAFHAIRAPYLLLVPLGAFFFYGLSVHRARLPMAILASLMLVYIGNRVVQQRYVDFMLLVTLGITVCTLRQNADAEDRPAEFGLPTARLAVLSLFFLGLQAARSKLYPSPFQRIGWANYPTQAQATEAKRLYVDPLIKEVHYRRDAE